MFARVSGQYPSLNHPRGTPPPPLHNHTNGRDGNGHNARPNGSTTTPGTEQSDRRRNFWTPFTTRQIEERPAYNDDAPPPYEDVAIECKDLTIEQLRQGIVNCHQCNEKHVIYECPQLLNMNATQQRTLSFCQLSETWRAQ